MILTIRLILSFYPNSFQHIILELESSIPILISEFPPAGESCAVGPLVDPEAVFQVVAVLATVAAPVQPAELPVAVQLVIFELPFVATHVLLDKDAVTLDFVPGPKTVVAVPVFPNVFAFVLPQTALEITFLKNEVPS